VLSILSENAPLQDRRHLNFKLDVQQKIQFMLCNYSIEKITVRCQMIKIQSVHCYCTLDNCANCTPRCFVLYTQVKKIKVLCTSTESNTQTIYMSTWLLKTWKNEHICRKTYILIQSETNFHCHLPPTKILLSEEVGIQFKQNIKVKSAS